MNFVEAFKLNGNETNINILREGDNMYFQASDVGIALQIKNIHNTLRLVPDKEKVLRDTYTLGGSQECTYLTEFGLYDCIFRSRTMAAAEFRSWVFTVIQKIRQTGQYDINGVNDPTDVEKKLREQIAKRSRSETLKSHVLLTKEPLVYMAELVNVEPPPPSGYIYVKIGETKDIKQRGNTLGQDYGKNVEVLFFKVVKCIQSERLEEWLLKHPQLSPYRTNLEINGHNRREVFTVDEEKLALLETLADKGERDFRGMTIEQKLEQDRLEVQKQLLDVQKQFLEMMMKPDTSDAIRTSLAAAFSQNCIPLTEIRATEATSINEERVHLRTTNDPCVQKYDADDITKLIKSYDGKRHAERDTPGSKSFEIYASCIKNTVHAGFRWHQVKREDKDVPQEIAPTVVIKKRKKDFVAQLDIECKNVIAVFPDAKQAAASLGLGRDAVTYAMSKKDNVLNDYLWHWWGDLSAELKETFEGDIEALSLNTSAKSVMILDRDTDNIVRTYNDMSEACRKHKTCHQKINDAIRDKTVWKGYRWRRA